MTAVLHVTCDLCNRPIEFDRHILRVESGSLRDRRPSCDFCNQCFSKFLAFLELTPHVEPAEAG